jgi:hypothetical protein
VVVLAVILAGRGRSSSRTRRGGGHLNAYPLTSTPNPTKALGEFQPAPACSPVHPGAGVGGLPAVGSGSAELHGEFPEATRQLPGKQSKAVRWELKAGFVSDDHDNLPQRMFLTQILQPPVASGTFSHFIIRQLSEAGRRGHQSG